MTVHLLRLLTTAPTPASRAVTVAARCEEERGEDLGGGEEDWGGQCPLVRRIFEFLRVCFFWFWIGIKNCRGWHQWETFTNLLCLCLLSFWNHRYKQNQRHTYMVANIVVGVGWTGCVGPEMRIDYDSYIKINQDWLWFCWAWDEDCVEYREDCLNWSHLKSMNLTQLTMESFKSWITTWKATMRKRGLEELWLEMISSARSAYISVENTPGNRCHRG